MPFERILHEGDALALYCLCNNNRGTIDVLAKRQRDSFHVVAVHFEGRDAKCPELFGKRLQIGDVACPPKPLKAVQIDDECKIQAVMTTEYQRLPIRPLIPFAIGGQTEEATFPALQFLSQGKARGKAKPVPKTAGGKRNLGNTMNGGGGRLSGFRPCERS